MAVRTSETPADDTPDTQTSAVAGNEPAETGSETLYRHKKRPEWGVAILAWEKEKSRAYQFEDGKLRKFKEGYYGLMEEAKKVERSRDRVVSSLQDAVTAKQGSSASDALTPVCSFQSQVALFKELFPKGFEDPKWIEEHRGTGTGRALKRHRDPLVRQAQETLDRDECETLLAEGQHEELTAAVAEVLANTNLVPLSAAKALKGLEPDESKEFAEGVFEFLHGEGDFDDRFQDYLKLLQGVYGGRPSWRIATALPALVFPENQACVRPSVSLRHAATIAPSAPYSKKARAKSYRNFRRMAFAVRKRLQAKDLEPKDLLDVHDFVWLTLRNAALEHVKG